MLGRFLLGQGITENKTRGKLLMKPKIIVDRYHLGGSVSVDVLGTASVTVKLLLAAEAPVAVWAVSFEFVEECGVKVRSLVAGETFGVNSNGEPEQCDELSEEAEDDDDVDVAEDKEDEEVVEEVQKRDRRLNFEVEDVPTSVLVSVLVLVQTHGKCD